MRKYIFLGILVFITAISQANASDKPLWENDVSDISIPSMAAQGVADGVEFKAEKASFKNGILELRQGKGFFPDQAFMIFTFLKNDEPIEGKKITVKPSDISKCPHIHFKYKVEGKNIPETKMFTKGYAMKLEFDEKADNKIKGKIYLCLPDEKKSFVAGIFEAEMK